MGAEQGAEAQQAPQMRYNAKIDSMQITSKSTDGSPLIKARMGANSCSLPEMQIGTKNTEKTPDDSDDSE